MRRTFSRQILLGLAFLAALNGCDESPTDGSPVITLQASQDSAPADGRTMINLVAGIDPAARPDRRTVVFKTTAGTLLGAGGDGTLKVSAGTHGRALAQLESPSEPASAVVSANIENLEGQITPAQVVVKFTAIGQSVRIGTSSPSARADGVTVTQVFADTDPGLTVTFTTTHGMFGSSQTAMQDTNAQGRATVDLTSPSAAATARLTARVGLAEASTTFDFIPVGQRITIGTSRFSAPADGATVTQVFADTEPGLTVTFTASHGTFGSSQTAMRATNSQGRATVDLTSPSTAATARLTARVDLSEDTSIFEFEPALPDAITVTIGLLELEAKPSAKAMVTVTLIRNVGDVTEGTAVKYRALSDRDEDRGATLDFDFRNRTLSNSSSQATAELVAGATDFRGTAVVEVTVSGSRGVGRERIEIIDPQM